MERNLFVANPDDDQEEVAETISKYDLLSVPVVDDKHKLLGIVTIDDALDVLEEEAEEDLVRATGRSEHKEGANPLAWLMPRRSGWIVLWLIALFGMSLASSTLNSKYMASSAQMSSKTFDILVLLAGAAQIATLGATILPLILISLEESAIRGIELLTDAKKDERPSLAKRFLFGGGVASASGLFSGIIVLALTDLLTGSIGLSSAYGLCVFAAALVSGLLLTALVNMTVRRDDKGKPTSPAGISLIAMLVCTVIVLGSAFLLLVYVPAFSASILG